MKILEVTFDCTIAMPGYSNVKPGVARAILDEGETPEQAWTELNRRAQAWHKSEYPHLYQDEIGKGNILLPNGYVEMKGVAIHNPHGSPIPIISEKKSYHPDDLKEQIQSAPTLEILSTFKLIANSNPDLYEAYMIRVKQLTNEK